MKITCFSCLPRGIVHMFYVERGRITKSTGTSSEQVPTIYSYHTYALFFLDLVRPASSASIEEDDRLCGHHLLHGLKLYPRQQQQLGLLHAGQEAAAAGRDQWTAAAHPIFSYCTVHQSNYCTKCNTTTQHFSFCQ